MSARYPQLVSLRERSVEVLGPSLGLGVKPGNLVWIFGVGRSGSTWLQRIMGENEGHAIWNEPMVGQLFGGFHESAGKEHLSRPNFIMSDVRRKVWARSVRNFVLDGARFTVPPSLGPTPYLVIKEPNGSMGAPVLMESLPESRMILLVRDPRDVVASTLDAARKGGWLYDWVDESKTGWREDSMADKNPDAFVKMNASVYLQQIGNAKRAYEAHEGRKVLVRYEDLLADTLRQMLRIYEALEIPIDHNDLARSVEKHSWEKIPENEKGQGKFYRKGASGGWREDLTPEQVEIVERVTAPLLTELYPE